LVPLGPQCVSLETERFRRAGEVPETVAGKAEMTIRRERLARVRHCQDIAVRGPAHMPATSTESPIDPAIQIQSECLLVFRRLIQGSSARNAGRTQRFFA